MSSLLSETEQGVVNSEIGSLVQGSVNTDGDFIGRDHFTQDIQVEHGTVATGHGARAETHYHEYHYHQHLPLGIPFQVPPLPPHFVPRPEMTNTIKNRLLKDRFSIPGILVISALHGLGGIGKSTIAAALAYDQEVQERFNHGVLWATLGQQPDLLSLLMGWVHALGDYDFHPTTVGSVTNHLRTLLQEKATLLIVDDVWQPEHITQFIVGGTHCQMLVTTRRADVAELVGADLHQMDVMIPSQSLGLLEARLGHSLKDGEQQEALKVAKAVGFLPLALELAAVRVSRGTSWQELHQALESELTHLEALESSSNRRRKPERPRLKASFNLSLNALKGEDEEAWRAFIWLAVLPEDVRIAAPVVATLWQMDEKVAMEVLELLWNDALLLSAAPIMIRERMWPAYRVHDLLHDLARDLLATDAPHGLGLELSSAHSILLESYRKRTQMGVWHTLPDDGYVHAHLTWHMEHARQISQIHTLLLQETDEGLNGWYIALEKLGQVVTYVDDVRRAWRMTVKQSLPNDIRSGVALLCRYALIITSFNSLAKNIPPILLGTLVGQRLWTPAQGLTYVHWIPNCWQQIEVLAELALYLPQTILRDALTKVRVLDLKNTWTIQDEFDFQTPESQTLLQDTFADARAINDAYSRAKALSSLAPYSPMSGQFEILQDALKAVNEISSKLGSDTSVTCPAKASSLIPLTKALETARRITDGYYRAEQLAKLVSFLPEHDRAELLTEALTAVRTIGDSRYQLEILKELSSSLTDKNYYLDYALGVWRKVNMPDELTTKIQTPSQIISGEDQGAKIIKQGYYEEELRKIQNDRDEKRRTEKLIRLISHLPSKLVSEALKLAKELTNERYQADILIRLASNLPEDLMIEAFIVTINIGDEQERARTLVGFASHLPEVMMGDMLDVVQMIADEKRRAEALRRMASHLPKKLIGKTLVTARNISNREYRVEALAGLLPYLTGLDRDDTSQEIIETIQKIDFQSQIEILKLMESYLVELPPDILFPIWCEILHQLTRLTRQDLISSLRYMFPLIDKLGQSEAIVGIFYAIQDVNRWWP